MKVRLAGSIFALLCIACSTIIGPDLPASPVGVFDRVWHDLDLHYAFFDSKNVNWDSIGVVYRPSALAVRDSDALAPVLIALLSTLHDGHIRLSIDGRPYSTSGSPYPNLFDPTITFAKYIQSIGGFSSGLSYGTATPTVGYIRLQTFEGSNLSAEFDTALARLESVSALIIDVRHNGGGLVENAASIAGRFASFSQTVAYVRYRNGPAHSDFTGPIAQSVGPAGSRHFAGKVYLLTDRNTYSAAELFVLSMRALGNTTVVGDTTGGEAGSPLVRELQNGWTVQFPESIEYTLEGREFEDIGIAPDVRIQNTTAEINLLVDAQLERAIGLASRGN